MLMQPASMIGFAAHFPELHINSSGVSIEIYKDKGLPENVLNRFEVKQFTGTHALGHSRMATESNVTIQHSHPFSTGQDLCLVHNGSLSNHNRLREKLQKQGIIFRTDNDSEVAAGYLMHRMWQGDSLDEALESALENLDGFFTFAIGTRDGFAVLRDPVACKPAIMAETAEWGGDGVGIQGHCSLAGRGQRRMLGTGAGEDLQLESLMTPHCIDLEATSVRDLNQALHELNGTQEKSDWQIMNPKGRHAVAVGIDAPLNVNIDGHTGYYCGGMNKHATITINGNAGPGVAENMMSGLIRIRGQCLPVRRRHRPWRPARYRRQRQFPLRHFHEGRRYSRKRLRRTHGRVYGPGGTPGYLRRRGGRPG